MVSICKKIGVLVLLLSLIVGAGFGGLLIRKSTPELVPRVGHCFCHVGEARRCDRIRIDSIQTKDLNFSHLINANPRKSQYWQKSLTQMQIDRFKENFTQEVPCPP